MTRKKKIYTIEEDMSDIFEENKLIGRNLDQIIGLPISTALRTILRQMEISGNRPRTISDYQTYVNSFIKETDRYSLDQITTDDIYRWLASMNVSAQTRLSRLKCLKAFFSRCYENGWFKKKFWKNVNIKVDTPIKEGTTDKDINLMLSVLDLTDFVQLRDATAAVMMYQTGLRSTTVAKLEIRNIYLNERLIKVDGDILKNRQHIILPFDEKLRRLLIALINQNNKIKESKRVNNSFLFITMYGESVLRTPTNNLLHKRFKKYMNSYGIKNINPHALRRGFAKRLLKQGANVAVISKALGHRDLSSTTRYLHMDKEEVAESLRKYL